MLTKKSVVWTLINTVANIALVVFSLVAAFDDRYALAAFLLSVVIFSCVVNLETK